MSMPSSLAHVHFPGSTCFPDKGRMPQTLPRPPQLNRSSKPAPIDVAQADTCSPPCTPKLVPEEEIQDSTFDPLSIAFVLVIIVVVITRHCLRHRDYGREGLQWDDCKYTL